MSIIAMVENAAERRLSQVQRAARTASQLLERLSVLSPEDRDAIILLIRNDVRGKPLADVLEAIDERS